MITKVVSWSMIDVDTGEVLANFHGNMIFGVDTQDMKRLHRILDSVIRGCQQDRNLSLFLECKSEDSSQQLDIF